MCCTSLPTYPFPTGPTRTHPVGNRGSYPDKLKLNGRGSADKPLRVDLRHQRLPRFILGERGDRGSVVPHTLLVGGRWL